MDIPSEAREAVVGLVILGATWIWRRVVKQKARRDQIENLGSDAYHFAEQVGLIDGLRKNAKLAPFIGVVEDALAAEGAPKLTKAERGRLEQKARRLSMITKRIPAPPPLPAPPGG